MFFFPDKQQTTLTGIANHSKNIPANGSYTIKLKPGRSLVSEAALQHRLLFSSTQEIFDDLPIIDQQILSALSSPHFIGLPLINKDRLMGVIAIGCNDLQAQRFGDDTAMLLHFAGIVAESLAHQQQMTFAHQQQLEQKQLEIDIKTKKIIHEANNPLTIINNYLEILSMDMEKESDNQKHLQTIKAEVDRVGQILLQLREEPMQEQDDHARANINQLIENLVALFKPTFYKLNHIKSRLDLDKQLPEIKTDQNKVKQIITNLLRNAAEAVAENGLITIKTKARVFVGRKQYIEIIIADNGPGIDDSILDNLFSPVKSTKGSGHSGLGLTIVNKLVTELKGSISYSTSDAGGAEFIILLPRDVD